MQPNNIYQINMDSTSKWSPMVPNSKNYFMIICYALLIDFLNKF